MKQGSFEKIGQRNQIRYRNRTKENQVDQMVREVFGSWEVFRRAIRETLEYIQYNPLDKSKKTYFIKDILGNYYNRIGDYSYIIKLADIAVKEARKIRKEHHKRDK